MTVIAVRGRTMACDSAWSTDGRIATLKTKLVRLRSGAIYGSAGDSDDRSMLALVQDATRFEDFPSREVLEAVSYTHLTLPTICSV